MSTAARLSAGTAVASVSLAVADLDRSLAFWQDAVGFRVLHRDGTQVHLGTGTSTLLSLVHRPGAVLPPRFSTGLFHVAILLPTRRDLARTVQHVAAAGHSFYGASDHDVSEAFYLDDPDHNGVELYRDRPAVQWEWRDGLVRMGTRALDVDQLMAEVQGDTTPWSGLPAATRIGHLHLKVGNLPAAERFYRDALGFDLTQRMRGAAFFAAGRYHHHVGANIWHSEGAPPPPPNAAGLVEVRVTLPASDDLDQLGERLGAHDVGLGRSESTLTVVDPWGHVIHFAAVR